MGNFIANKSYFMIILDQKETTALHKTIVELERIDYNKAYFQYNGCEITGTIFGNIIVSELSNYHSN